MIYRVVLSARARRALAEQLPESVAKACREFLRDPLAESPYRVGTPLRAALDGLYSARRGQFRIIYRMDVDEVLVEVIAIAHRRDVYRT